MARTVSDLTSLFNIMQDSDVNDSNCIDFNNIEKVRYSERLSKNDTPLAMKKVRVGVVKEFDIEELDNKNRKI